MAGQVSAIVVDNTDAAEKATRFLLESGHEEIGIILGNEGIYTTQKRRDGYLNAYSEFAKKPREELIRFGDYTMLRPAFASAPRLAPCPPRSALTRGALIMCC